MAEKKDVVRFHIGTGGDGLQINEQLNEQTGINFFRSIIKRTPVMFPKELGEAQPFDAAITEGIYEKFGFINSLVEKKIDQLWGNGFHIQSDNEEAQAEIEDWIEDVRFISICKRWTRDFLVKPYGVLELGGSIDGGIKGIKVLDSKYVYKTRDIYGNITGYNQFIKGFPKDTDFSKNPLKPITNQNPNGDYLPLDKDNIVEFSLNCIGDKPYGLGIIYPNLNEIDSLLGARKDMHMLLHRKANNPYVITMGNIEKDIWPSSADITAMGQKLEYLHNKHEWTVGPDIKIEKLDFGDIAGKFIAPLENDLNLISAGFQTPKSELGFSFGVTGAGLGSNAPQEHTSRFELHIQSIQEELEKIIKEKIFKRILLSLGIDADVDVIWGEANESDKKDKITMLQGLINTVTNPALQREIEKNICQLLDYDDSIMDAGEVEKQQLIKQQQADMQKEKKPFLKQWLDIFRKKKSSHNFYTIENFTNHIEKDLYKDYSLVEWLGFNYNSMLTSILLSIDKDPFDNLAAINQEEIDMGYLSSEDIEQFKEAMKEMFEKGLSVKTFASTLVKEDIISPLYDKYGNVVLNQELRSLMIARTESTRISAIGAVDSYKANNIQKVRFRAALTTRTCGECMLLNGNVYKITEIPFYPPIHPFCRCALSPVVQNGNNG